MTTIRPTIAPCTTSGRPSLKRIGITTTVPVEVVLAAGGTPVDLNNLFINDRRPERLLGAAERAGFPQNCCAWIKGIYGACREHDIDTVICVTTGDCSNTLMLMEVLRLEGVHTIPFAYPASPDVSRMHEALESLAQALGTSLDAAEEVRRDLAPARRLARQMDRLTWREGKASGWENHLWQVSASDFGSDHVEYTKQLRAALAEAGQREPADPQELRLAYIGVPPIFGADLYRHIERHGGRVVFNEVQRQFAMPHPAHSLAEQYAAYTYPYSIHERLHDILPELRRRRVDAVVHYVQTFCHRAIADIVFRRFIGLPLLTLEGNHDYILLLQTQTKIEAFMDMVRHGRVGRLQPPARTAGGRISHER